MAGENLDLPIVGKILKDCGAFFIKREWGNNTLYKTIMEEYIATLLAEGSEFPKRQVRVMSNDTYHCGSQ